MREYTKMYSRIIEYLLGAEESEINSFQGK
ncbi:hypothetical protein IMSAGC014_02279 [Bacteroidaceae bacterium]|nr:hypothetical protein IMSAGC014_02279 [Bacteroidaceae bacterium]